MIICMVQEEFKNVVTNALMDRQARNFQQKVSRCVNAAVRDARRASPCFTVMPKLENIVAEINGGNRDCLAKIAMLDIQRPKGFRLFEKKADYLADTYKLHTMMSSADVLQSRVDTTASLNATPK